ncbi:glycoside hydrolase domain-containing protein [Micromonospora sp. NPDC050686]|uniref:glycoside hydrolase domain-containing protein n=1 Tax=Micromonospora sp. NPDC050686 TaxID=3154631 RepID=UPI0033F499E2
MNSRNRARTGRRLIPALLAGVVSLAAVTGLTPAAEATTTAAGAGGTAADASMTAAAAAGTAGPQPGTYTGVGFDACTAPSSAAMRAWLASPYRAVGIYFGGANRACAQPNLTAAWVTEQQAAGWHLMPIYLGSQAPCSLSSKRYLIDPPNAAAQGRAQAEDAVAQAKAIGLARQSVLIFDMEAYRTGDAGCRTAVLSFMSAWTARLHDLGYLSGFYSSMASGVADQVAAYDQPGYARPDFLDFARWDGVATVDDPAIPGTYWAPKRRMKQYRGDHTETWGGVTINIDSNYLDVAVPQPAPPMPGDFTGDGWPDLVARQTSNGSLYVYPGNGTSLTGRSVVGTGWNGMDAIIRTDFTGDGREDVIGRVKSTGEAWLYPRTGSGWGSRSRIGTGWNILREITPAGDFNRDGNRDLLAVQTSNGYLYLYPGRGTGFGTRAIVGSGWNGMDELAGVGDFNRDGYPDLIARQKSNGNLYLYPGRGTGFSPRIQVGSGWNGLRDLVGVGDFNDDGYPDLIAVEKSTNYLYLYRGKGTGFVGRVRIGTGWSGMQPLL